MTRTCRFCKRQRRKVYLVDVRSPADDGGFDVGDQAFACAGCMTTLLRPLWVVLKGVPRI
jgi:hypothetical protein